MAFFFSPDWCNLFVAEVKAGIFFHVCLVGGGGGGGEEGGCVPWCPTFLKTIEFLANNLPFGVMDGHKTG